MPVGGIPHLLSGDIISAGGGAGFQHGQSPDNMGFEDNNATSRAFTQLYAGGSSGICCEKRLDKNLVSSELRKDWKNLASHGGQRYRRVLMLPVPSAIRK